MGRWGDRLILTVHHRQGMVQTRNKEGISEHGFHNRKQFSVFLGLEAL